MPGPYYAIKTQQLKGATPFYVAVVPAKDLLKWAEVPRKNFEFRAGYQRELNEDRVKRIAEFLRQDSKNIMPGAVIVAVKADSLTFEHIQGRKAYRIRIKMDKLPSDEKAVEMVRDELWARLGPGERAKVEEFETASAESENTEAANSDGDALEETLPDADELGASEEEEEGSVAETPVETEPEPTKPPSYLAREVLEIRQALKDLSALDDVRREGLFAFARAVRKPGLIIDGQHRAFGAKEVRDFNVLLPVVLIPGSRLERASVSVLRSQ